LHSCTFYALAGRILVNFPPSDSTQSHSVAGLLFA
jgi:hypothetical protein